MCHAYVYLGYIEDRAGRRQDAIGWYRKALGIREAGAAILDVARSGLNRPVTGIAHLGGRTTRAPRPGTGYVIDFGPAPTLPLPKTLSAEERRENFEFLWRAIDLNYACFRLKGIDWAQVREVYSKRLDRVETIEDYYLLLFQMVNELRDTHSWLQGYEPPLPLAAPALSIDLFGDRPYVTKVQPGSDADGAGVQPSYEIIAVDGAGVAARIEQLRPYLHACSSERAFRRYASRHLLTGEQGSVVAVKLRSPAGQIETIPLKRDSKAGRQEPWNVPLELSRQRFVHFGRHASGVGYIRIVSFMGREEIADEFDVALETMKDTPGLIVDVRDNAGGFGTAQPRMVGRFLERRRMGPLSFVKYGPAHTDLLVHRASIAPMGEWRYDRPVALLVNGETGSAADLFACEMRSTGRVVTVGSTTHGNLSGVAAYIVTPCGLVVRISNGYMADANGRAIEGNGNEPDVVVEPSISDFLKGADPVLERAVTELLARGKSRITKGP